MRYRLALGKVKDGTSCIRLDEWCEDKGCATNAILFDIDCVFEVCDALFIAGATEVDCYIGGTTMTGAPLCVEHDAIEQVIVGLLRLMCKHKGIDESFMNDLIAAAYGLSTDEIREALALSEAEMKEAN